MLSYGIDWTYILVIIGFIIALIAQFGVKTPSPNMTRYTAREI